MKLLNKVILINDKIINIRIPFYYTINDMINDLINVYDLDIYYVYSIYTDSDCILYTEEYLNPELYINDIEEDLILKLRKELPVIFNIKKLIRKLNFFNWI